MEVSIPKDQFDALIYAAMTRECSRCGDSIVIDEEEAIELIKSAWHGWGASDTEPLDEEIFLDEVANMCDYCNHMTDKDD